MDALRVSMESIKAKKAANSSATAKDEAATINPPSRKKRTALSAG
jgi:hypothetical protein